ncbi:MAG: FKBP-type peptidyl-prolyl cis-trans isomerase [Bacteroidales bacterium]
MKAKYKEYADANSKFLEENAQQPNIKVLPCGVQYRVIKEGEGPTPTAQSIVQVFYKGTMINGKQFDSNLGDGFPAVFRVREVITGWQEALKQMSVGSKWEIFIPAHLGYGGESAGIIKKYSTLIFEVELVGIS